jgi:hypothetical protein
MAAFVVVIVFLSQMCLKDCLVKLLEGQARLGRPDWSRVCVWYALLFHRLIKAVSSGVISDVRRLIQRCMADPDDDDPVNCRVVWMPHTHHLFPDAFKVMRVVGWVGWVVVDTA